MENSSESEPTLPQPSAWNVPNAITSIRFVVSILVIVSIGAHAFWTALALFLIAASTDWMDGWWARTFDQRTKFGRIFDPFVDKVLICGSFIALVPVESAAVPAWLAIVIVCRELLVSSLRGLLEGSGEDFSANLWGKLKMVVQCVAVPMAITHAALHPNAPWYTWSVHAAMLITAWITIYSGTTYCRVAARKFRNESPPESGTTSP